MNANNGMFGFRQLIRKKNCIFRKDPHHTESVEALILSILL